MFIQKVTIDGFKSYAARTVIDNFDQHFNAITGLNGSGKSNILDAICFVLGITNLSHVRAGNLSELVYKQGQAGVSKATVSITFNNDDPSASPVGYEQCDEVTVTRQVFIGGRSKYTINGRNAQAGQVANLFHSVQLNVNNPHFLIMQGRITKVLNMKPKEILGMMEEAAGTRMYETKRVAALKTIDKKQAKLDELNAILAEEITPTLDRLRSEKENYLKWVKNSAEIEHKDRYVVAYEFYKAQQALEGNADTVQDMTQQLKQLEEDEKTKREQIAEKEQEIEACQADLAGTFEAQHQELRTRQETHSKQLVKVSSAWENKQQAVQAAQDALNNTKVTLTDVQEQLNSKRQALDSESQSIDAKRNEAQQAQDRVAQLATDLAKLSAGTAASDGEDGRTLPEQIADAHSASKTAESKHKQLQLKMNALSKKLKSTQKEADQRRKSADKLTAQRDQAQQKVDQVTAELEQLDFDSNQYQALAKEQADLKTAVDNRSEQLSRVRARVEPSLVFDYADPVRGFDRTKVKGRVANLVRPKDPAHATALEVIAGKRLYEVVVDEAITGKALLNRGQLRKRVTIIPLDKVEQKNPVTPDQAQLALRIANGSMAHPAIDLVEFDEEFRHAMEYVFGSCIVASDANAANQICQQTKKKTVTLDGDSYNPSGMIQGGSRGGLGELLGSLSKISSESKLLEADQKRLAVVDRKVASLQSNADAFERLSSDLEVAQAALAHAQEQLERTTFGALSKQCDEMTAELEAAEQECEQLEQTKEEQWNRYNELKDKEQELTKQREDRLEAMRDELQQAKMEATQTQAVATEAARKSDSLSIELEHHEQEVEAAKEAVKLAEEELRKVSEQEADLQIQVGQVRATAEQAQAELDTLQEEMSERSAKLADLKKQHEQAVQAATQANLDAKKLSLNLTQLRKEKSQAERIVASMQQKHGWIQGEMDAFGEPGGDYDFAQQDPSQVARQLKALKGEQDTLGKRINKKVMSMIERAESEYQELLRKRKVVENDKKKIQDVIQELDGQKKSKLEETWKKVNVDFGSIFSTLLPGTTAKLEPPEGLEAWEGLEVKVAFGNVWKDSLIELSGGQRSLLALSLILSLLLFKPAPMYILDEVDAALDLSHTQNIGNMLKTHFSQSQFIVVSLKEGMFHNANVIFRTKFVDGVSTVTRTLGSKRPLGDSNAAPKSTRKTKGK